MAQELNFDELDHAVNQYMQRKGDKPAGNSFGQSPIAATPSSQMQPAGQSQAPTPVSMPPKRPDVTSDARDTDTLPPNNPHDVAHAEERPAMRIAPRRAIAPRPAGGRSATFHDIAPPRRAPAFTTTHLQSSTPELSRPVASRPVAASQSAQSAVRPVSRFSDVAPLRPSPTVKPETEENTVEKIVPKQPFSEESGAETPVKVLGGSEEVSKPQEAPEDSQITSPMMSQEPAALPPRETVSEAETIHKEEVPQEGTFGTSPDLSASEPKTTEEPSSGTGTFDAETTQASFASQEPAEVNEATPQEDEVSVGNAFQSQDLASLDKITARPAQPDLSLAQENTGRLAEQKAEWPSTAGLLDTGELHTPAMLPGDEKGMNHENKVTVGQVFDTKPYHAPIQGGHAGTSPARVAIIVTLIVVFVLIAAVAVFMYVS